MKICPTACPLLSFYKAARTNFFMDARKLTSTSREAAHAASERLDSIMNETRVLLAEHKFVAAGTKAQEGCVLCPSANGALWRDCQKPAVAAIRARRSRIGHCKGFTTVINFDDLAYIRVKTNTTLRAAPGLDHSVVLAVCDNFDWSGRPAQAFLSFFLLQSRTRSMSMLQTI